MAASRGMRRNQKRGDREAMLFYCYMTAQQKRLVRRAALKKLFSDPHFNVMDGLDVYIDDYSKTEPIPAAMLAGLRQAQNIFQWAKEDAEAREKVQSDSQHLPRATDEVSSVLAPPGAERESGTPPEAPGSESMPSAPAEAKGSTHS